MKKSIVLLLIATSCLFTACEPVPHYNRVKAASLTGDPVEVSVSKHGKIKPYGSVKLYQTKAEITEKCKTIAIMSVAGDPGDEARFITAFLYRAADMGADAVLLDREGSGMALSTHVSVGWAPPSSSAVGSFRAEAIRFEH